MIRQGSFCNKTLNSSQACSSSWGLYFNASKVAVNIFVLRSSSLNFTGPLPYTVTGHHKLLTTWHSDLGVPTNRSLKFDIHIKHKVTSVSAVTTNLLMCVSCREPDFLMNIYLTQVRPVMDDSSRIWNIGYCWDFELLERVQRRRTRAVRGLENALYGQRLRQLDLLYLQGRLLPADLIYVWRIFTQKCAIKPDDLFQFPHVSTTKGHSYTLYVPVVSLDIRKHFFT